MKHAVILLIVAVIFAAGCGSHSVTYSQNQQTTQVDSSTSQERVESGNQPKTVDEFLDNHPWTDRGWKISRGTVSTLVLNGDEAIISIFTDSSVNKNIKWLDMYLLEKSNPNKTELAPAIDFLTTLAPTWPVDQITDWLQSDSQEITKGNYVFRLDAIAKEGFHVVASRTTSPSSTPATNDRDNSRDFEKLVIQNGAPLVVGASVEGCDGKAYSRSSAEFLGVWVTSDWHQFTEAERKYIIKLHVDVFNKWKGDDEGIVIFYDDFLNEEVGHGSALGVDVVE